MSKVVIVGGGASGLVAAIYAAKNGNDVIIAEKNDSIGKKILVTGNGRCNYWNENQNLEYFESSNKEYVKQIITKENQEEILNFFDLIGIKPKVKNGYYYPFSNQANSMRNALQNEINNLNINVITNFDVKNIEKDEKNFIVTSSLNEKIYADKVILSCGSKAGIKENSKVNAYEICENLGIEIINPLPALVQLKAKERFFKEWNGIRSDVKVELYENNKKILEDIGEIQLTDYGISGICVFNLSSSAIRGIEEGKKEFVKINFVYGLKIYTIQNFIEWINARNTKILKRNISELLNGILNDKLINVILKKSKLNYNSIWDNLDFEEKNILAKNIVELEIEIIGSNGFEKAQVCSGGAKLDQINTKTMETKKIKNLYITGELLDVNGRCGGYNLEWAWITGMLAGRSV